MNPFRPSQGRCCGGWGPKKFFPAPERAPGGPENPTCHMFVCFIFVETGRFKVLC